VGSAAGWLWGVIHPIVLFASYYFIFGLCLKIPIERYPLVLITGMLPWLLFSDTVTRSASSLVEQASLITKTVFPAEIVPLAIFLSSLLSHVIAVALVFAAATLYAGRFNPGILLLPIFMFLLGLFAVGIGWIASSLQVYLRDTAQLLTVALTFWLWVTPIFIAEENFPRKLRFLIALNPLAYIVRPYREMLMGTRLPAWHDFAIATVFCGGTFLVGGMFFRYMKRGFADVL
jgi:ABC-type polysaccharide/polyol phosphate export permease